MSNHDSDHATIREVYALIETVETRVLARLDKVEAKIDGRMDEHDRKHISMGRFWITTAIAVSALMVALIPLVVG